MNVLNEFVALTTKMPEGNPLEAGLRAAVEALGLKPVVWRNFGDPDACLQADASVGAYDLDVLKALPIWKRNKKIENPAPFYWYASSGGDFSIASGDGYASVIEAKLAAETWLREELLQYIPYCVPCGVEGDDVHS